MKPTNQDVEIYAETNITTTGDGWRLVANCGGYQSNRRGENAYEENVVNAKLIAALWNMVRALNPADPLAAANALPDVVAALESLLEGKVITSCKDAVHPSGRFCTFCGVNSPVYVHASGCPVGRGEDALTKLKGGAQ